MNAIKNSKNRGGVVVAARNWFLGWCLLAVCCTGGFAQDVPRILNYQGKVTSGGVPVDGVGQFKFALLAPSGSGVSATATVTSGFVTSVNVTSGGSGFVAAPAVILTGGGGSGAAATATISGGVVTAINIVTPGSGYASEPTVSFLAVDGDYGIVWKNDGTTSAGEPATAVALTVSKGLFSARLGDTALPNMAAINSAGFTRAPLRLRVWFNDGAKGWQLLGQDIAISASPSAFGIQKQTLTKKLFYIYWNSDKNALYTNWGQSSTRPSMLCGGILLKPDGTGYGSGWISLRESLPFGAVIKQIIIGVYDTATDRINGNGTLGGSLICQVDKIDDSGNVSTIAMVESGGTFKSGAKTLTIDLGTSGSTQDSELTLKVSVFISGNVYGLSGPDGYLRLDSVAVVFEN